MQQVAHDRVVASVTPFGCWHGGEQVEKNKLTQGNRGEQEGKKGREELPERRRGRPPG